VGPAVGRVSADRSEEPSPRDPPDGVHEVWKFFEPIGTGLWREGWVDSGARLARV